MNNTELQELFADVVQKVKMKSGSLEITEINTGAKGFKLDKEARLWKKSKVSKQKQKELEKVFKEAKGLSSTTGH
jgi:coenzyme F420-reducing hydrogenase beta subunit